MDCNSGSNALGAGTLNSAAGKRKADDIINAEDAEAPGYVSEELEDLIALKRLKFGRGLNR